MRKLFLMSIAAALVVPCAHASAIALTFSGGQTLADDPTIGWVFNTSNAITITDLGFFDQGGNGLIDSHQVAIWNTAGVLQGSALVPSGTAGTLDSGFRFVTSSFVLAAGTYVIGGDKPSGADVHLGTVSLGNVNLAAGITYIENRYIFDGGAFLLPTTAFAPQGLGYFGPSFRFDPVGASAVPEPASWSMMTFGGAALFLIRRRLSQRAGKA